ncbi:MAG: hypothetical protein WCF67_13240 [Chitinophagaceae bacterium]
MKSMSKWAVLIVSFFLTIGASAAVNNKSIISFVNIVPGDPEDGFASVAETKAVVQEILDVMDVKASFEVREARIPNAAAATLKGKRYILYNPAFIYSIYKATGSNRWVPISILAHEIGHHLKGHTITPTQSNPAIELEADEFAGFALRRMGASLEDAQLAMRIGSGRRASSTHPARQDRLEAIANGWEKADDQLLAKGIQRSPRIERSPAPSPVTDESTVLDEQYIAYDVHFKADPDNRYHVTVRNHLVKLAGNKLAVFGKLLTTNSSSYPYALKAGNNLLFVSRKGSIVTADGRSLGYVKAHEKE